MSTPNSQQIATVLRNLNDPLLFVRNILQDDPWPLAEQIFAALDKPRAKVAVKGCHNSGKSFSAAEFVLYFLARYDDSIIITTAPREEQVTDIIWKEIRLAAMRSLMKFPEPSTMALNIGVQNYAKGQTANAQDGAVRMQGYKAPHLLYILDEAPGIAADVYEAIEANRAGNDVRILLLGNPTIPSGPFYDAFTSNRESWSTITIDAYATPNFEALRKLVGADGEAITAALRDLPADHPAIQHAPRPYLATPLWAQEKLRECGENSAYWQARVRGQFPTEGTDSLISLAWLEKAKQAAADDGSKLHVGVDVAGPGEDETCVYVRQGPRVIDRRSWYSSDPRGDAEVFLNPIKPRIVEFNVDSAGIGYYFAKHFEDLGYPVNYVNVGETGGVDSEHFFLLKAQLYWGLRQRFRAGDITGLMDEATISQLSSIRYKHNARGQVVIESKEEARKRGVKSPDRAEALMLAFADRTPGILDYYRERVEVARNSQSQPPEEPESELAKVYQAAYDQWQKQLRPS